MSSKKKDDDMTLSHDPVLRIGWAQTDITISGPIPIAGQFHARICEGVSDPVTATVLALDSGDDHAVLISCDLVCIPNELWAEVRQGLNGVAALDPMKVVMHATHTHTGPETRTPYFGQAHVSGMLGVDLDIVPPAKGVTFIAERIVAAVREAWTGRRPGSIAFGLGHAVVGRNRRWVSVSGQSTMYGNTDTADFSHIEGYEDHSVGVLATRDAEGRLTGLAVNVPCPSQVSEHEFKISADYWCETRAELRRRFGKDLFILAQCSAAGDQSPHLIWNKPAENRMLERAGRTVRQTIARRIAHAVDEVLDVLGDHRDASVPFRHHVEILPLPKNAITEEHVQAALRDAAQDRARYEEEIRRLEADPALRAQPHWYVKATSAFRHMKWCEGVADRFEQQKTEPDYACELHVIRLGDAVLATNPFEYYLDYGVFIKARSKARQTFLVQLAGAGTYVPTKRSTSGGGYGSVPASNIVGPEGGRKLAERTIEVINGLY